MPIVIYTCLSAMTRRKLVQIGEKQTDKKSILKDEDCPCSFSMIDATETRTCVKAVCIFSTA